MPLLELTPYVDGWYGGASEKELTVVPKFLFPFENYPTPDVYSRGYERIFEGISGMSYKPKIANRTAWTNLLTYSEQFDNAAWTKTALTVTANAGTAPDGQATLDKLLETTATSEHNVTQAATVLAVAQEAFVFARAGLGRDFIRISYTDSAAATFSGFFDIASGTKGTLAANTTSEIVSLGNGDFQCIIRFTPAAGAGTFKANVSTNSSTISYTGDAAKGVYLWGAQVAAGTKSPYTSTTTATRTVSAPDRDPSDPMAYLGAEEEPVSQTSSTFVLQRRFYRVPNQQIVPAGYLFSTPNYTPGDWPSNSFSPPSNSYGVVGAYAYFALSSYFAGTVSTAILAAITGYYDSVLTITAYTGSPATVLTIPGHSAIIGSRLIYRRNVAAVVTYFYFDVSGVSGNDLTGISTTIVGAGLLGTVMMATLLTADDYSRRQTRLGTDQGDTRNMSARTIEDYYLPGVTPGIATATDIPEEGPFELEDYFAAWAEDLTWFNVQASTIKQWNGKGPILVRSYTQAVLAELL